MKVTNKCNQGLSELMYYRRYNEVILVPFILNTSFELTSKPE